MQRQIPPGLQLSHLFCVKSRLTGNAAAGNAYNVADMASLPQAVRNAGANNVIILGGLAYSSDFSQWVALVNNIPTLASRLNGLSIANVAASSHSYDFNSRRCAVRRSPALPAGGARRSTRTPRAAGGRRPAPRLRAIAHREVGDERRGEVDGEAGVGPLLEPRRHRRKHQHHAEELGPRELHPEVGGEAKVAERLRHLRQAQLRVGGEAHLQAEERGDDPEADDDSFGAGHAHLLAPEGQPGVSTPNRSLNRVLTCFAAENSFSCPA